MKTVVGAHEILRFFPVSPAFARVYCNRQFENDEGETVLAGAPTGRDYVKQVTASYAAGITTISPFSGANRIDSTVDSNGYAFSDYLLSLHDIKGNLLQIIETNLFVPPDTPLTWDHIIQFNRAHPQPQRYTYYDAVQIERRLADIVNGAAIASSVQRGVVRLDVDAVDLNDPVVPGMNSPILVNPATTSDIGHVLLDTAPDDPDVPIAVGENSPLIMGGAAGNETDTYRSNLAFVTVADAIAAAYGNVLAFTAEQPITVDTTLPRSVRTRLGGLGKFNVSSTRTLTIDAPSNNDDRKWNIGPGKMVQKSGTLRMANWIGPFGQPTTLNGGINNSVTSITVADGTAFGTAPFYIAMDSEAMLVTAIAGNVWTVTRAQDSTAAASHSNGATVMIYCTQVMWDGIKTSASSVSGGCDIIAIPGKIATRALGTWPTTTKLIGTGGHPDAIGATAFVMIEDAKFAHIGDSRYCGFERFTVDFPSSITYTTGGVGFDIAGTTGGACVAPYIRDCTVRGGRKFLEIRDTASAFEWFVVDLDVKNCSGLNNSVACTHLNRVPNISWTLDHFQATPLANQTAWAHDWDYPGQGTLKHSTSNGVSISNLMIHTAITAIDVASTTAAEDVDISETTITVANGAAFGAAPFVVYCEMEQWNVTAIAVNDWTVTRAYNGSAAATHANGATIRRTTKGLITATGHGCTVDDPEPVTILNSGGTLPGTYVDKKRLFFNATDADHGYLYENPRLIFSSDEHIFRFIPTNAGTGTNTLRTTVPRYNGIWNGDGVSLVDIPAGNIRIQNTIYGVTIWDCQEESLPVSLRVQNTYQKTRGITIGGNTTFQGLVQLRSQCRVLLDGFSGAAGSFKDAGTEGSTTDAYIEVKGATCIDDGTGDYYDLGQTLQSEPPSLFAFAGGTLLIGPDSAEYRHNVYRSPSKIVTDYNWKDYTEAIDTVSRLRNSSRLPIRRTGLHEIGEDSPSRYYGDYHLDSSDDIVAAYPFLDQFLMTLGDDSKTAGEKGKFNYGHHFISGRSGNLLVQLLASSGGVTTLDASLAAEYYFNTLSEDTTINLDATAGREAVQVEHKTIYIPATTTNRVIVWGSGFVTPGIHELLTLFTPGTWVCRFSTFGGNNLRMESAPFFIPSGVAATPDPLYFWRGVNANTQIISDAGYLCYGGVLLEMTFPVKAFPGQILAVKGANTNWILEQNAGQYIQWDEGAVDGTNKSTTGVGGSIASIDGNDCLYLVNLVTDTVWGPLHAKAKTGFILT